MKKIYVILVIMCGLLFSNKNQAQTTPETYIHVSDSLTSEQLVKDILVNDPCALVDNIQSRSGDDYGGCTGISYFKNSNPDFPISEGVVLATANAAEAEGPFTNSFSFNCPTDPGNSWTDDSQLSEYINDALNVDDDYHNATSLEFEFTPVVDSLSFNFVFASNEYGTYQCDFSDPFAFFLENADTGEITNLAIVPGTDDPISVITIRDEQWNGSCASVNKEFFGDFYGPGGEPANAAPINFSGNTVLLNASGAVKPFQKYRLKVVIQNRSDTALDSAVFLEAGSFNINSTDFLGGDILATSPESVCAGESIDLSVNSLVSAISTEGNVGITWTYNGTELSDLTDQTTITVEEGGTYGVSIESPDFDDCAFEDEILVDFKISPILPEDFSGTLTFCEDFEKTLVATPTNLSDLNVVSYQWYKDGVEVANDGSTLTVSETGEYTVVVSEVDCETTAVIEIVQPDYTVDLGDDIEVCDQASVEVQPVIDGVDPNDPGVTYQWNTGATTESISISESGTYSVQVFSYGCVEEDSVNVTVRQKPIVDLGEDFEKCKPDTAVLEAAVSTNGSSNLNYTWYRDGGVISGETGSSLELTEEGIYTVEVYGDGAPQGCVGVDEISVSYYENANCIIPQGLSPNDDGINDCLDLSYLQDKFGAAQVSIFNRYGTKVFEQKGYINEWCGQSDNHDRLPVGTYYYVIQFKDEAPETGYIYLNY